MRTYRFKLTIAAVLLGVVVGVGGIAMWRLLGATITPGVLIYHAFLGFVVALAPIWFMRTGLDSRISQLKETICATSHDGDLSRRAATSGGGEIAAAADAFNELVSNFQAVVGEICAKARQMADAADTLIKDSKSIATGSDQQGQAAEAAQQAMKEMASDIDQVAESAELTAHNAQAALDLSHQGTEIAASAAAEIERIARAVEESARVMIALGERSQSINGIVRVIRDIADQTNMLALNAAIEAARAGEQGRGFAVVADEVRKLAENTSRATGEIQEVIQAIQVDTQAAITAIQQGTSRVKTGADLARQAAESLQQINDGAAQTRERVDVIASTIQEHSMTSQSIASHMEEILRLAGSNTSIASETLKQATVVDSLATDLQEISRRFEPTRNSTTPGVVDNDHSDS